MGNNNIALKILLLIFGLLFSVGCHADKHTADKNTKDASGKFHLIYLVSTDKLEPGAKAFVEPLFFTDGERLVFAYNYCRQYYLGKYDIGDTVYGLHESDRLDPKQIADDLTPIHQYCENNSATIDVKNYIVRDSIGISLILDQIQFTGEGRQNLDLHPPTLPGRGSASIKMAHGMPLITPDAKIKGGQQYFFLMASNSVLLDKILPIKDFKNQKSELLLKRVRQYAEERTTSGGRPSVGNICKLRIGNHPSTAKNGPYLLTDAKLLASAFGDIDGDGLYDLVVSLQEKYLRDKNTYTSRIGSTEIRLFYGNGMEQCLAWDTRVAHENNPTVLPLAIIQLGQCKYLATSFNNVTDSIDLVSLSEQATKCKNVNVNKYKENIR